MKLNCLERMHLLGAELMPSEGDRFLCGQIRTAKHKLELTDPERKAIDFRMVGIEQYFYSIPKAEAIEVEIFLPPTVIDAIWLRLQQLDRTHKLRPEWLDIYDKFEAEKGAAETKESGYA